MLMCQQFSNLDYRRKQVDTLKVFNDNVVEVNELQEYCVHFVSAGRNFMLTVLLGANFPNERPRLLLSPIVQHYWINASTGEVEAAPGLLNYTPHSDLGRVVQAVIREFERFPPPILKHNSPLNVVSGATLGIQHYIPNAGSELQVSSSGSSSTSSSKENSPHNSSTGAAQQRPNESSLPNLSSLSLEELKQLDTDPEFFDDFIEEMSVVQQLNEELDTMISEVESISYENQSKETHLEELKQKLNNDVAALKNLGQKCDELNKKYLRKSAEFSPQHIRELLQIAASNADTDCERHVEQFLSGEIDVQTFLQNYTHSKKLSSERKAKEERLGQQLSALERAGI